MIEPPFVKPPRRSAVAADARVVITGMAINTPLGDTLAAFLQALLRGRSAIGRWRRFANLHMASSIGADLSEYDAGGKARWWQAQLPEKTGERLLRFTAHAPWSTRLSLLLALDAWTDAGLTGVPGGIGTAIAVGGHNINAGYHFDVQREFARHPDRVDPMYSVHALDTDHAASVAELLGVRGPAVTVGGACASGNIALRAALDEIRHHGRDRCLVVGPIADFSPVDLQALATIGAISCETFHEQPERASRPFDVRREGFVPAHGGAALVVENLDTARRRGVAIYAEVLGVEASADANHRPQPSLDGQLATMQRVLAACGVAPGQLQFVSAHATSTRAGDVVEAQSVRRLLGPQSAAVKVNAAKSMIGHTGWSAALVETVAAVLQTAAGRLHASINIDQCDPGVDLDVCSEGPCDHEVDYLLKNSFGYGGINAVSLLRRYDAARDGGIDRNLWARTQAAATRAANTA